jgi:hypothetical protein
MLSHPRNRCTATCRKCSEYRLLAARSSFPAKCALSYCLIFGVQSTIHVVVTGSHWAPLQILLAQAILLWLCNLASLLLILSIVGARFDTEEVDGSNPFGPTISRFSAARFLGSIPTDNVCAPTSQNLLSEISGPPKDVRPRASLSFHHLRTTGKRKVPKRGWWVWQNV